MRTHSHRNQAFVIPVDGSASTELSTDTSTDPWSDGYEDVGVKKAGDYNDRRVRAFLSAYLTILLQLLYPEPPLFLPLSLLFSSQLLIIFSASS